jgi:hypothetical protein
MPRFCGATCFSRRNRLDHTRAGVRYRLAFADEGGSTGAGR